MDPGETNKGLVNESDDTGKYLGAQFNKIVRPTLSDILADKRSKASEDEVSDDPSPIVKTASPHNNIEALDSPQETLNLVACHCRCTRISESGFMNGNDLDRLRDEVKDPSKTYELASSPNCEDFFSHGTSNSVSRGIYGSEAWRTPRSFRYGSPPGIQPWFQTYQSDQSDGDTASEEDIFGYTLSNINTDEPANQEADEDDASSQDMSDTAGFPDMGNPKTEEDPNIDEGF